MSELSYLIFDKNRLEIQSKQINDLRLDLRRGQQCVRDFFLCLNANMINWPDVYSTLAFQLTYSTECSSCHHKNESDTMQLHFELPVPPNNSNLKDHVEDFLTKELNVGVYCEEGCDAFRQKIKRTAITNIEETKFITVILTRAIETLDGFQLVKNKIDATDDIEIRYSASSDQLSCYNLFLFTETHMVLLVSMK